MRYALKKKFGVWIMKRGGTHLMNWQTLAITNINMINAIGFSILKVRLAKFKVACRFSITIPSLLSGYT
jgi:hypothetical protein